MIEEQTRKSKLNRFYVISSIFYKYVYADCLVLAKINLCYRDFEILTRISSQRTFKRPKNVRIKSSAKGSNEESLFRFFFFFIFFFFSDIRNPLIRWKNTICRKMTDRTKLVTRLIHYFSVVFVFVIQVAAVCL